MPEDDANKSEATIRRDRIANTIGTSRYFPDSFADTVRNEVPLDEGVWELKHWLDDNLIPLLEKGIKDYWKRSSRRQEALTEREATWTALMLWCYSDTLHAKYAAQERRDEESARYASAKLDGIKQVMQHVDMRLSGEKNVIEALYEEAATTQGALGRPKLVDGKATETSGKP